MSLAWAAGTMRAATAAAEPARRAAGRAARGPRGCGSGRRRRARSCPSSPARARWSGRAARARRPGSAAPSAAVRRRPPTGVLQRLHALVVRLARLGAALKSFSRNGTPRNGPSGQRARRRRPSARSSWRWITALRRAVDGLEPLDGRAHQLGGVHLAPADQLGQPAGVVLVEQTRPRAIRSRSTGHAAAVDQDRLAGHELRVVRQQVAERAEQVVRAHHPPEGRAGRVVGAEHLGAGRRGEARAPRSSPGRLADRARWPTPWSWRAPHPSTRRSARSRASR